MAYELAGKRYDLPPHVTRTHEGCFDGALALRLPGSDAPTLLRPTEGARYRIEAGATGWRVVGG